MIRTRLAGREGKGGGAAIEIERKRDLIGFQNDRVARGRFGL